MDIVWVLPTVVVSLRQRLKIHMRDQNDDNGRSQSGLRIKGEQRSRPSQLAFWRIFWRLYPRDNLWRLGVYPAHDKSDPCLTIYLTS